MSFWVNAQVAVKRVVNAPKHKHSVNAVGLFSMRGLVRISKKIPATTIVLECSRAETGVGPSMAEGSQGWRPNCADFPVAARIRAISGSVRSMSFEAKKICWISHELRCIAIQAMLKINPMSPTRLYSTACSAAVLASDRAYHQPINRKDIIPTPSHPINN